MGYHRAGFDVTGVDIAPQKNYPFEFIQADAIHYLAEFWENFEAVHASPPCQRFSQMSNCRPGLAAESAQRFHPLACVRSHVQVLADAIDQARAAQSSARRAREERLAPEI